MGTLLQDLRYAVRMLVKSPGFTAIAVFTLALGIGANTALFSVVNGVLLSPLPYPQPDRLATLYSKTPQFEESSISYPNFLDWQRQNNSFTALAAWRSDSFNMTGSGEPQRLRGEMVSADFFNILGFNALIGRTFTAQDDHPGAAPVVILSNAFWKRRFGASPKIVGQTISLNGTAYAVIGVLPSNFYYTGNNFGRVPEIFLPLGQWTDKTFLDRRVGMGMDAMGRLKPGVTLAQARADMDGVAENLGRAYPGADKNSGVTVHSLKQDMVGDVAPLLYVLLGAVGFVLLIACVNIANLLLARSTGRTREFAIRAALGASRGRMVRQLLTESVLLSFAGGVIGLLLAAWGTHAAITILPQALPRSGNVGLDTRVLIFTLGVSLLAGILFGLAPALKTSQRNLSETLKEGGRGSSGARHRLQGIFVVSETALALILLVGAGLMIRSLVALWNVNPGYNPHHVLNFGVAFPPQMAAAPPQQVRNGFWQLEGALESIPGVTAASASIGSSPMQGDTDIPFWIEGHPKPQADNQMPATLFYFVQPDYLKVMQTPLLAGRFLTPQDTIHTTPTIVIDEYFAQKYFPNENPIGKRVNFQIIDIQAEIVGVVGHIKQWGLDENAKSPVLAQAYFPLDQIPDQFWPLLSKGSDIYLRSQASPEVVIPAVRQILSKINSDEVMYGTETMDDIISDSLAARRFGMILLGVFAVLALALACVGIYGVISYLVGQRTHEIGIRIALGAQRSDVLRLILGQGTRMALIGVAIGIAAALGLTRLMANQLFGVTTHDPLTFGGVAFLLTLVAVAACYIPARRAMRTDPIVALRYE
ncbi:MAG TPA: ABC transporter permease [Candidatus Acidoferrales bacterium]|nr:ABC transporter permease [Candidatus Acidoferrales bacterium]